MSRVLEQCRLCRRAGQKLYLKGDRCHTPKCAVTRRNYPPGAAGGKKSKPRLTTYGIQLREKQKARFYYGVSEKQLHNYFERASTRVGNTAENLYQLLEMRLDNTIRKLGWTPSDRHARQVVNHGHVLIDGKKVSIPSYQVKGGQVITVVQATKESKEFQEALARQDKIQLPGWLHSEKGLFEGKVIGQPALEQEAPLFDMKLIIEFYSR